MTRFLSEKLKLIIVRGSLTTLAHTPPLKTPTNNKNQTNKSIHQHQLPDKNQRQLLTEGI
jgi:predicted small lipoprotein YifL